MLWNQFRSIAAFRPVALNFDKVCRPDEEAKCDAKQNGGGGVKNFVANFFYIKIGDFVVLKSYNVTKRKKVKKKFFLAFQDDVDFSVHVNPS